MKRRDASVVLRVLLLAALAPLAACASPEAARSRGGGPGADVGNRDPVVEMHAGSVPYYRVQCNTTLPECNGPRPVYTARQLDSEARER